MKNWIIIWSFNQIVGYVGPLPYDYKECVHRAVEINQELDEKWVDSYIPDGAGSAKWLTRKDMSFKCIQQESKPVINLK